MARKIKFPEGYKICHAYPESHRHFVLQQLLDLNFELQRYLQLWGQDPANNTPEFIEDVANNLETLRTTILAAAKDNDVAPEPANNAAESSKKKGKGKAKEPKPHRGAFQVPDTYLVNDTSGSAHSAGGSMKDRILRPLNRVTIALNNTTLDHIDWNSQLPNPQSRHTDHIKMLPRPLNREYAGVWVETKDNKNPDGQPEIVPVIFNSPPPEQPSRKDNASASILLHPPPVLSPHRADTPRPSVPKEESFSPALGVAKVETMSSKLKRSKHARYALGSKETNTGASLAALSHTVNTRGESERAKRKRNVEEDLPLEEGGKKKHKSHKK